MNELAAAPATPAARRDGSRGIGQYWQAFRRRQWPALAVALSVLVVALLTAFLWPATYRSTGTILIEQQELPSDLVQSTITSYADQRIQVISQRVMTTDNLLRIIERYDLYPRLRREQPREVLLAQMRKDIKFEMISADVMDPRQGRATKADIAFTVSYDSRSPEVAARVANELVSLYLDENLRSRRQQSADAAAFLDGQAAQLRQGIDQLQAKLATFKDQHINTLPDEAALNHEQLLRAQEDLRDVDTQLRALEQQITYLDAQLAQISPSSQVYTSTGERVLSPADRLKFLRTEYARLSGLYAADHPDVIRVKREIEGLEQSIGTVDSSNDLQRQLQDARTQLAAAQQRYAPDHPDVVRLQRQVDTLSAALRKASEDPVVPTSKPTPDNPAYIEVQAQREASMAQRDSLQQKHQDLEQRIDDIERRIAASPAVDRDFSEMMTELDDDQLKYREVQQKQLEAKMAASLEDQQKGERFSLIDPPLAPEIPASPNRRLLSVLGLLLALGGGVGTTFALEASDSSIRDRDDLESLLHVPPLAVLPHFVTHDERLRRKRQQRVTLAGVLGACALALVLTHLLYRPLDVLWDVALRKWSG